jgi:hypothetical protein
MMKTLSRKLVLRHETVRDLQPLDEQTLRKVRGGANTNTDFESGHGCPVLAVVGPTA